MSSAIQIVQYQPRWPEEFSRLGGALRDALGPLAVRIDHIGSTSVPGLAAKDVIDIQVTVRALEPDVEGALQAAGWVRRSHPADHVPPGAEDLPDLWAKWFFNQPTGQRRAHLHVRVAGRPNQRYPLLFRDFLRHNAPAAQAYARAKMELARAFPQDLDAYCTGKDPVCDIIVAAAEEWAAAAGWQPGPTDA